MSDCQDCTQSEKVARAVVCQMICVVNNMHHN